MWAREFTYIPFYFALQTCVHYSQLYPSLKTFKRPCLQAYISDTRVRRNREVAFVTDITYFRNVSKHNICLYTVSAPCPSEDVYTLSRYHLKRKRRRYGLVFNSLRGTRYTTVSKSSIALLTTRSARKIPADRGKVMHDIISVACATMEELQLLPTAPRPLRQRALSNDVFSSFSSRDLNVKQ